MIKTILFLIPVFILVYSSGYAQNSDSLFKHIAIEDLCKMLSENPDKYVLVDVRTPEEYINAHEEARLNIGHLKGAINIPTGTFEYHYTELDKYADKEMIIYCSHSRRSRIVSEFLVSKGYSNFYNLDGGLSKLKDMDIPCKEDIYVK